MKASDPKFAKCSCQYCNGHIEFDAAQAGETSACPHCGLETKLFVPTTPPNSSDEVRRGISPLGIAALVLGILSCFFCWIPLLGLLALPLAAIGVLLAIAGIIMANTGKKAGLAFPIGGGIVCVVAMSIALVITGGFSRAFSSAIERGKRTNQESDSPTPTRETTPSKQDPTSPAQEPKSPPRERVSGDWSKSRSVKQGQTRVTVSKVHIGSVNHSDVLGRSQTTDEEFFTIDLGVANLSSTKKMDFQTWRGGKFSVGSGTASLKDNHENNYKRINIVPASANGDPSPDDVSIYPQKEQHDLVVFESPVENIEWLHLELPASNFGGDGMLRLEIPMTQVMAAWKAVRVAIAEREAFWATSPTMAERMRVQGAYHRKVDAAEARLAIVETNLYAIPQ